MSSIYLMSTRTDEIAAELFPGEKVEIHETRLWNNLINSGVSIPPEFKEKHDLSEYRIYPSDDPKVFAVAFEKFHYPNLLWRTGYTWKEKEQVLKAQKEREYLKSLTDEELAKHVLDLYMKEQKSTLTEEGTETQF